jgi:hypothetical protein
MIYISRLDPCLGEPVVAQNAALYDRLVSEATAAGFKLQMLITGVAASWGDVCNHSSGTNPNISNYQTFVATWVPFFYSRGVRRFSLWNEPNLKGFLCAQSDPNSGSCNSSASVNVALWLKLYQVGTAVIRALQQNGTIGQIELFFGEYAGFDGVEFTDRLWNLTDSLTADGFSWHPYQFCNPPSVRGPGKFLPGYCQRAMQGMGYIYDLQGHLDLWANEKKLLTPQGQRVPMYGTEFGYQRSPPDGIPEEYRAQWYVQALEIARVAGAKGFVLYQFYPAGQSWDTSLLESDGSPTPSLIAIQAWAKAHGYNVTSF